MKRLFFFTGLFFMISVQALSGSAQVNIEWLYDTYRTKYLAPFPPEEQVESLEKIQTVLGQYKMRSTVTKPVRDMVSYLQHLFCHTESLISGYYCQDSYHPESLLTADKDTLNLAQIRYLLTQEHSRRRMERWLSGLKQSEALHAVAQSYALELCAVGEITHTLNGSTLEVRYQDGGYEYVWWGENLGLGQVNIMELLDQLTTSYYHRVNMYQKEFRELGIGQCDNIWVLNYWSR